MTQTLEPRPVHTGVSDQPRLQRRPRMNTETWSWYFMRVSGLVLLFLALAHFTITHITHDVTETNADFVTARWQNPLWRTYDWVLLALGLMHGVNGVRFSMDDYIRTSWKRATTKVVLYSVTATLFIYGSITIFTFQA